MSLCWRCLRNTDAAVAVLDFSGRLGLLDCTEPDHRCRGAVDLRFASSHVETPEGAERRHVDQPHVRGFFRFVGSEDRVGGRLDGAVGVVDAEGVTGWKRCFRMRFYSPAIVGAVYDVYDRAYFFDSTKSARS